jgi:hypothetical protein
MMALGGGGASGTERTRARLGIAVASAVLVVSACASEVAGGQDVPVGTGETTHLEVTVSAGRVEPPLHRVELAVGENVELRVTADRTDRVHVHGIDQWSDVSPDQPAVITFAMPDPGVYDIELEDVGIPLLQLEVR